MTFEMSKSKLSIVQKANARWATLYKEQLKSRWTSKNVH